MRTLSPNSSGAALSKSEGVMHITPPRSHRFVVLDALRGIAALFVVAFHLPRQMTSPLSAQGPLAVDFFFCLSGFVIAFSYEGRLASNVSFKDFAVARLIRLYPIYAAGSLLGLSLGAFTAHFASHRGWSWAFFSPWVFLTFLATFLWPTCLSTANHSFNYPLDVPAWSIFYEIVANLAYALLVRLRLSRTLVILSVVVVSFAPLFESVALRGRPLDFGSQPAGFGLGFPRVAFSFFIGVLVHRAYRRHHAHTKERESRSFSAFVVSMALLLILSAPLPWMRAGVPQLIGVAVCFPLIVYYGARAQLPHAFARFATALGELSYPLYLLHFPFILLMNTQHFHRLMAEHPTILRLLVPCFVLALAAAAWQVGEHIDLPARRALTRLYNNHKQRLAENLPQHLSPESR